MFETFYNKMLGKKESINKIIFKVSLNTFSIIDPFLVKMKTHFSN